MRGHRKTHEPPPFSALLDWSARYCVLQYPQRRGEAGGLVHVLDECCLWSIQGTPLSHDDENPPPPASVECASSGTTHRRCYEPRPRCGVVQKTNEDMRRGLWETLFGQRNTRPAGRFERGRPPGKVGLNFNQSPRSGSTGRVVKDLLMVTLPPGLYALGTWKDENSPISSSNPRRVLG